MPAFARFTAESNKLPIVKAGENVRTALASKKKKMNQGIALPAPGRPALLL
jgi:hypothetical protein